MFVLNITSSMYCPAHKNKPSSSKTGHFDLVYCSVLKPLSRNSWHHCMGTSLLLAAHAATPTSSIAPGWTNTPQNCKDTGLGVKPTGLTIPSVNVTSHIWSLLQENKSIKHLILFQVPHPDLVQTILSSDPLPAQEKGFLSHRLLYWQEFLPQSFTNRRSWSTSSQ